MYLQIFVRSIFFLVEYKQFEKSWEGMWESHVIDHEHPCHVCETDNMLRRKTLLL